MRDKAREGRGNKKVSVIPSIAQNLILLSFVRSKPFSVDFGKFFPIEFENYCRQLPNSSFDQKFSTEKRYNETFLDKSKM